jgi:hypothetical protein
MNSTLSWNKLLSDCAKLISWLRQEKGKGEKEKSEVIDGR